MDEVNFHVYTMKEPDYVISSMSTDAPTYAVLFYWPKDDNR